MTTIAELSDTLQTLLTTTADALGKATGFIQRERQVTGAGFAQTLVLGGLAQPAATRRQQQQTAVQAGMRVSVQGLEQRFNAAAVDFLRALLEAGLTVVVNSPDRRVILPCFRGVYLTDCTRLGWGHAGVKLALRWELQQGQLQASLSDLNQNDQHTSLIEQPLPPGALHLGDLGFFKLTRFQQWNAQGVYWLTRFKVGTRLYQADGTPLDLLPLLETAQPEWVIPVQVGAQARLRAYLVAARLPPQAQAKRLTRLQDEARRDQRPLSARQAALSGWSLYLTNIPTLTAEQAHVLARTRWQIELLFKLWKSHGKLLRSRSADPLRQQCEGYAKLLGVVVAHWLWLVSGWQYPRLGALDALRIIRTHVPLLLRAFTQPQLWFALFTWLRHDFRHAAPLSRRRTVPLVFQLWQDFELVLP